MRFIKKLTVLSLGNVLPQFVVLASTPVISRYYKPEHFGSFFYYFSLAGIMSVFISGMYFHAIYVEKDGNRSKLIATQSSLLALLVTCLICAGIALLKIAGSEIDGTRLLLCALLSLGIATNQTITAIFICRSRIKSASTIALTKTAIVVVYQLTAGLLQFLPEFSLLIGAVFGELLVAIIVLQGKTKQIHECAISSLRCRFEQLKEHRGYPLFYLPSQVTGLSVNFLPLFLLNHTRSMDVAGIYSLALRLASSPINAISNSLKAILWSSIGEKRSLVTKKVMNLYLFSHAIGVLFALLIYTAGDRALKILLGSNWSGIEFVLPLVVLWQFSSLANVFPAEILKNNNCQLKLFQTELISGAIKVLGLLLSMSIGSTWVIVIGWCFSAYAANTISSIFALQASRKIMRHV